jgi:hypothetical protein
MNQNHASQNTQLAEVLKHVDVEQAVVEKLIELGWSQCIVFSRDTGAVHNTFHTAVGEKVAHAYLSNGDGFNRTLHGTYQSEGRNILEPHSVLIPQDTDLKTCVSLAAEFAVNVETVVSNSFAERLMRQ